MTEAEWLACEDPTEMLQALPTKATTRQLALLCVACCRGDRGLMRARGTRQAITFSERIIEGEEVPEDEGPSDGDCYLMASAVNQTMGAALCVRDQRRASPLEYVEGVLEVITDSKVKPTRTLRRIAALLRDIFGNPFRPVAFDPAWRTPTAVALAQQMYESRDFSAMPILADALQDAGCDCDDILAHCRGTGPHVRGCWVVDAVLGKE